MKKKWAVTISLLLAMGSLFAENTTDQSQETTTSSNLPTTNNEISWKPYFTDLNTFCPKKGLLFQANVGVGFLYFSGIKGQTNVIYPELEVTNNQLGATGQSPIKGKIQYNRTPVFEYLLAYQWAPWVKAGLSYQHQGGIAPQTQMLAGLGADLTDFELVGPYSQLRSNLSLDAFMMKVIFELPLASVWYGIATTPYFAVGVGPGWQSWTNISLEQAAVSTADTAEFLNTPLALRNKYSANAVWMADAGLHFQSAKPNNNFSILVGCKYNQWGQARNIGKSSQQGSPKYGLASPFRIKTLYSFVPYLGVQWSFSNQNYMKTPYMVCNRNVNQLKPFVVRSSQLEKQASVWTQFNVGAGFLYFSGVEGNTLTKFTSSQVTSNESSVSGASPFKGHIRYNRTPLLEYLVGYQWKPWIKGAISYQHQGGVSVQTQMEPQLGINGSTGVYAAYSQLRTNLSLDSLMAKAYFELPYAMICKGVATSPYLALGVGPGWQSWTSTELFENSSDSLGGPGGANVYNSIPIPLRNKYAANAVYMIDAGFHFYNAYPDGNFSVLVGCKYNQWGQARNIGKLSQQYTPKVGLFTPFSVKTLYSFAPYLGVQWNFGQSYVCQAPYQISNKDVSRWTPFVANVSHTQKRTSVFTQFNVGAGFLYFSGLNGNIKAQLETAAFTAGQTQVSGQAPFKGPISYNRTPLFEYLLGYQALPWFKAALSYQHQGGVSIQTPKSIALNTNGVDFSSGSNSQLCANLSLDALEAKFYFELPYALICKGIATTPYLAVGVGPGWQSWTSISLEQGQFDNGYYDVTPFPLRSKYICNAVWMADVGMHFKSAYPDSSFSILVGCKYNEWGQARNIGKVSQQGEPRRGLEDPFRIKMIYSFAPYLGVQWDF